LKNTQNKLPLPLCGLIVCFVRYENKNITTHTADVQNVS